jgi:SAM-dependent methyltransferase
MLFKTDKVINGYMPTYYRLAAELGPNADVCEIGVQNGYGLEMWRTLFPEGRVVGVDIDPEARWPEGCERIVCDQASLELPEKLDGSFDLIVDDASHIGSLTAITFRNLWPLVKPGRYYVIEDWGVGFKSFKGFDSSMLRLAESMLDRFEPGNADPFVESITYSTGLMVIKRTDLPFIYPA